MIPLKISIITVAYNNAAQIQKTIGSVSSQTYSNIEYIIIDGGSSDGSVEIIKNSSEKISYWISENDNGIYHAMNKGIAKATGDYLLFLNSGDVINDNQVLSDFYEFIKLNGHSDIVYGDYIYVDKKVRETKIILPDIITFDWLCNASIPHPSTFIKKSLFDKFGLYNEDYTVVSDWLFVLKIFVHSNSKFIHYNRLISKFHEGGISTLLASQNMIRAERDKGMKEIFSDPLLKIIAEHSDYKFYWKKYKLEYIIGYAKQAKLIIKKIVSPLLKCLLYGSYIVNTISSSVLYKAYKKGNNLFSKTIPIIINNRNRYTFLKKLIDSLKARGYYNIYIIDNASTYQPLLEYYKKLDYKIYYLTSNTGFCALWDTVIFEDFKDQYYVYTDSDLELPESCPDDFLCWLMFLLSRYNNIDKAGLGLKIDDLPTYYQLKDKVVQWESSLIQQSRQIEKNVFKASVDTTFALYRPNKFGPAQFLQCIRTYGKYQISHLPWYTNLDDLNEEESFYINNAHTTNYAYWTAASKEIISQKVKFNG
jgi:glycosyltransferase involved in cell wall biosynthesis